MLVSGISLICQRILNMYPILVKKYSSIIQQSLNILRAKFRASHNMKTFEIQWVDYYLQKIIKIKFFFLIIMHVLCIGIFLAVNSVIKNYRKYKFSK